MPAELININSEVISGGIARFIVVLIISFVQGALIGFEREKAKVDATHDEHYKGDFPGLRTFSLIAITGGLSGVLLKGDILVPAQVASLFFLFSA
ncbi:MAG: MgtC/SapB family protein, partial [Fervidicoccaceae archaeon]